MDNRLSISSIGKYTKMFLKKTKSQKGRFLSRVLPVTIGSDDERSLDRGRLENCDVIIA